MAGSEVKFDKQGDGLARYDILNYQKLQNASGYHYRVSISHEKLINSLTNEKKKQINYIKQMSTHFLPEGILC